ncbi:hypothetical protein V5735_24645 (plasmid) [Haladaptatus sp. SPP-AMP-3]
MRHKSHGRYGKDGLTIVDGGMTVRRPKTTNTGPKTQPSARRLGGGFE